MPDSRLSSASYELEISMAAKRSRVWQAISTEASKWWPSGFVTSERTQRFVIEAKLGGRAFEELGNGDGLVWYSVIGVDTERQLTMAVQLLPPFGGPATTALSLTLAPQNQGIVPKVRDDRFGILGGASPVEGRRTVFDEGLRAYVECADDRRAWL